MLIFLIRLNKQCETFPPRWMDLVAQQQIAGEAAPP